MGPTKSESMIDRETIRAFVDEVVRRFQPERVVLFGSYAYGRPDADSDVDLLVVMRHRGAGAEQAARIRHVVRSGFPLDLIVRSPANIRLRVKMGDSFIREILEKGEVLHEARHP
jgi:uncharacterized protein